MSASVSGSPATMVVGTLIIMGDTHTIMATRIRPITTMTTIRDTTGVMGVGMADITAVVVGMAATGVLAVEVGLAAIGVLPVEAGSAAMVGLPAEVGSVAVAVVAGVAAAMAVTVKPRKRLPTNRFR